MDSPLLFVSIVCYSQPYSSLTTPTYSPGSTMRFTSSICASVLAFCALASAAPVRRDETLASLGGSVEGITGDVDQTLQTLEGVSPPVTILCPVCTP